MRVVLSVEALDPQLTGIGRYVWELVQRLPTQPGIEALRCERNGRWIADPARLLQDPLYPRYPKPVRWLRRRTTALREWRDASVLRRSVCHGPNFFLPDLAETGVVTVHDLSVFRYPETHPAERLAFFERHFASTLRRAAHIITVSDTVRREVIDYTGFDPARVSTVYQGVSPHFHPRTDAEIRAPLDAFGLEPGGYALCVSTIEPRKRIAQLVQAWRMLPAAVRARWPLVLAGASGWLSDAILADIAAGEREGWLRYIRYVDEAALPALYAGARLFVYPSAYEGFGLPPIEAMASGVPAVVADASCLPEVTGGAAMLVSPEDVGGFGRQLERGLTDETWRSAARKNGLAVAAGYSWNRCATETVQIYRGLP